MLKKEKGSITVEASFIVSFTFIILVAVIFEGLLLHDKLIINALSKGMLLKVLYMEEERVASDGTLKKEKNEFIFMNPENPVDLRKEERALKNLLQDETIIQTSFSVQFSETEKDIHLLVSGKRRIPMSALFSSFFPGEKDFIIEEYFSKNIPPERILYIASGIKSLVEKENKKK